MELLTDKSKELFEEWLLTEYFKVKVPQEHYCFVAEDVFYTKKLSMQYGVYQDFFDVYGLGIEADKDEENRDYDARIDGGILSSHPERNEARKAVVMEANQILNSRYK